MNTQLRCKRCGSWNIEHLDTHTYCLECNYSREGLTDWRELSHTTFDRPKPKTEFALNFLRELKQLRGLS